MRRDICIPPDTDAVTLRLEALRLGPGLAEAYACRRIIAKGETDPWGYLLYHCGSAGNGYAGQDEGVYFARNPCQAAG